MALAFCVPMLAQITVPEPSVRALLRDNGTVVSLQIENSRNIPLAARVLLRLLNVNNFEDVTASRDVTVPPGKTELILALPIPEKHDVLLDRLTYQVAATAPNYRAFSTVQGTVNFSQVAEHAFTLGVVTGMLPRPGEPFALPVVAFHPATGLPAEGVTVTAGKASAVTNAEGYAMLTVPLDADDEEPSVEVTAWLGDFYQSAQSTRLALAHGDLRIDTDKPLYQPGQTMHVRILARQATGKAQAGEEFELRISRDGDEVYRATLTTSRFGIAGTDWVIPDNAKSGSYQVRVDGPDGDDDRYNPAYVSIRRYELPSFRVVTKLDRKFYRPLQKPLIDVSADYLFGKPVAAGRARVTKASDDDDQDDPDDAIVQGALVNGRFRATLPVDDVEIPDSAKFVDAHFIAYVTDASTNRTEQRKFDVRFSRDPLHIYVAREERRRDHRRLYVTTYSADGEPVIAKVNVLLDGKPIATGMSNRLGLARIDAPLVEGDLTIIARTSDGRSAKADTDYFSNAEIWLGTDRVLYRAGDTIRCQIEAADKIHAAFVIAWNDQGRTVFTKTVTLVAGRAEVSIPYDARFGRGIRIGVASGSNRETYARRVLFPGPSTDLTLQATSARPAYRPGETASIVFKASAEAALGIAIVDQSVFERVNTDNAFHRRWFGGEDLDGTRVSGISVDDLVSIDPGQITEDFQLVGELLLGNQTLVNTLEDFNQEMINRYRGTAENALRPLRYALDRAYEQQLTYPRDANSLRRTVDIAALDPWGLPYEPHFSTHRANDVISFVSAGPDKKLHTGDDFTAMEVPRPWFGKWDALLHERLDELKSFPLTQEGFLLAIANAGVRFEALRDPWNRPLRVEDFYDRENRVFRIVSGGPNGLATKHDDVTVTEFRRPYFDAMETKIDNLLKKTKKFPHTDAEFRATLAASGISAASLQDPWGHPYYTDIRQQKNYTNKIRVYTYAEYLALPEERQDVLPSKRTVDFIFLRSSGPDGVKGTYDDFEIAQFARFAEEIVEPDRPPSTGPSLKIGGTATIEGLVLDTSGAVVANATVVLDGIYTKKADANGKYSFRGLPPGLYQLSVDSPGFQRTVMTQVPARADHVTRVDLELRVGSVSDSVEVTAGALLLQTESTSISSVVRSAAGLLALSTPRVRDYFPETLYWQPELITDASGKATINVKLADNITTWHVAAIGSTEDGRITETSTEVRAFQPFLIDLDVPTVLTVGDQIDLPVPIRNYLNSAQKVGVSVTTPPALPLREPVSQPGLIGASSSTNLLLALRADAATDKAPVRITAIAHDESDALEKPISIHPDGQPQESSVNSLLRSGQTINSTLPSDVIPGSLRSEVKIYPSLLSRVLEAIESLLQKPHGCGEQTISSTYPNLQFLQVIKSTQAQDPRYEAKALKYLRAGYARLLNYRDTSGGFTYWGRGEPSVALTAYALQFLGEAKEFIDVDPEVIHDAYQWLSTQKQDNPAVSAMQLRALTHAGGDYTQWVEEHLRDLAKAAAVDDPYAIAAFALAAMDAGKFEAAEPAIRRLSAMAQDQQGAAFWDLRANTPFYGWGRGGRVETTALAVRALGRWRKSGHTSPVLTELIDRGALFLLRDSSNAGVWQSGQATVQALAALLETWTGDSPSPSTADLLVNGQPAGPVTIPGGRSIAGPITIDVTALMKPGDNLVTLNGIAGRVLQAQVNHSWYQRWHGPVTSKNLTIATTFNKTSGFVNDLIQCQVIVSRPSFRGYGMVIAEVGLPPGAEVDRGSLESILGKNNGVDSYEVAPDRLIFYIWPRAEDSKFDFFLRPRWAMNTVTAPSVVYDYYNPAEKSVLVPQRFRIGAARP